MNLIFYAKFWKCQFSYQITIRLHNQEVVENNHWKANVISWIVVLIRRPYFQWYHRLFSSCSGCLARGQRLLPQFNRMPIAHNHLNRWLTSLLEIHTNLLELWNSWIGARTHTRHASPFYVSAPKNTHTQAQRDRFFFGWLWNVDQLKYFRLFTKTKDNFKWTYRWIKFYVDLFILLVCLRSIWSIWECSAAILWFLFSFSLSLCKCQIACNT